MSGVFGYCNLDGRLARADILTDMSLALAHRGPDGAGAWVSGSVALGHRMLHTTPESLRECHPLITGDGDIVLIGDVRIDNRAELAGAVGLVGCDAQDVTDAELVLRAYGRWEEGFAERLLGDFAIAIWDGRRQILVGARDHFGVKPFYYHYSPGRIFAFASEIKGLLALDDIPRDIDDLEVARHLLVPVPDDPASTYYRHIRRLQPGHTLVVTPERMLCNRYWSLDPDRQLRLSSDDEYAEAVRDTFEESIRCRLRATTPVASMLSGGLDTSSIVAVAVRLLEQSGGPRLHTLSAVYPSVPKADESRFIRIVLEQNDTEAHFFDADRVSPLSELDGLSTDMEGANVGANLYMPAHLYRVANAHGIRVVLEGYDGDSTLSHGRGYLQELALAGHWMRLAVTIRDMGRILDKPWKRAVWSRFLKYRIRPMLRRSGLHSIARAGHNVIRGRPIHRPAASATTWARGLDPGFIASLEKHVQPPPVFRTEREDHYQLLTRSILLHTLGWVEATGAAAGVDVRFPFFDVRLAQLCLSLPPEQKLHRGWTRMVMRRAMVGILPEEIRWRSDKSDLSPAFNHAFRSTERDQLEAIQIESDRWERYVDRDFFRELAGRYTSVRTTADEDLRLWRAFSLALWLTRQPQSLSPTVAGS